MTRPASIKDKRRKATQEHAARRHSSRRSARIRLAAVLTFTLACLHCHATRSSEIQETVFRPARYVSLPDEPLPLLVDYGPCTATRSDVPFTALPRCVFDPRQTLRLRLRHPHATDAKIRIIADGAVVTGTEAIRDLDPDEEPGRLVEVSLPIDADRIEINVPESTDRFGITPNANPSLTDGPDRTNGPDVAKAVNAQHPYWSLPLRSQARQRLLDGDATATNLDDAFVTMEVKLATDEIDVGLAYLEHVWQIAHGSHMLSEGVDAVVAAAFHLYHQPERAEALLRWVEADAVRFPRGRAMLDYAWGIHHWSRGRLDQAVVALRSASRYAVYTDDRQLKKAALPMYATVLAEQGYFDASRHWAQIGLRHVRDQGTAYELAVTLHLVGWANLLLRRHHRAGPDPKPELLEALELFEATTDAEHLSDMPGIVRLSLAALAVEEGAPKQALAHIERIDMTRLTLENRVFVADLELRSLLALKHPKHELEATLRRLQRAVSEADTPEARWREAVRQGDVWVAHDELEMAVSSYRQAEEHLDTLTRLSAFGVGRSMIGVYYQNSNTRLVDTLLELDRPDEAFCASRQAQARRLQLAVLPSAMSAERREGVIARIESYRRTQRLLEQLQRAEVGLHGSRLQRAQARKDRILQAMLRETTELLQEAGRTETRPSCEELSPPAPGELILGLYPHGSDWLVFGQDINQTTVRRIRINEPDMVSQHARMSDLLLRPIDDHVREAQRIRVLAADVAQRVDVHLLPWEGMPLVMHLPVVYGVDLVPNAALINRQASRSHAMLLADPTRELAESDKEIAHAEAQLEAAGWPVVTLPPKFAVPSNVQQRWSTSRLLHYAGHADHDSDDDQSTPGWWPPYAGGTPNWPAYLRLAGNTRLAAPEILMHAGQVPAQVILAGCRTGVVDTSASGTSLALAFLAAGAREVIATTDNVDDQTARAIGRGIYAEVDSPGQWSLANALHKAQRAQLLAGQPVGTYRVWVR